MLTAADRKNTFLHPDSESWTHRHKSKITNLTSPFPTSYIEMLYFFCIVILVTECLSNNIQYTLGIVKLSKKVHETVGNKISPKYILGSQLGWLFV